MAGVWRTLKKFSLKVLSDHSDSDHNLPTNSSATDNGNALSSQLPSPSSSSSSSGSFLSRSFSLRSSKKTCAICLGSLKAGQGQAIFTAECSHTFHFRCIANNVKHGNLICPMCRSEWKDIPFQGPTQSARAPRNSLGRARVSPHIPPLENILSQQEPERFSDDEALLDISTGLATPSRPQPIIIKAFPEFPAVSASDSPSKFPLLVRICAPSLQDEARGLDRAPIDLVTVLDVSASMSSNLSLLKRAVRFVIQNLGPSDRLSIVTFSSTAKRILRLGRMSESGRRSAIEAVRSLSSGGGTNIVEGLKQGVRVLEKRRQHNPVASIILLTDGDDTCNIGSHNQYHSAENLASSNSSQEVRYLNLLPASICPNNRRPGDESQQQNIPVHTFGFGTKHDSTAMHAISDASGGTFSFIQSIDILQDAFARCIGGLLSVVAQGVRLTIRSLSPGVQIGSISSGKYKSEIFDQGQQADIDVGTLYAEEVREFLVYVSIPVSSASDRLGKTPLVEALCSYKDSVSAEMILVEGGRVEVRRPEILSPTEKIVCLEVDRQRNRLLVAEAIVEAKRVAETKDLERAQAVLAECRSILLSSSSAQIGDGLCNWLEAELREIRARMVSMELYERTGRAYILSGLSSHLMQRATTRGNSMTLTLPMSTREGENSSMSGHIFYETPSMVSMVSMSQNLNVGTSEQP